MCQNPTRIAATLMLRGAKRAQMFPLHPEEKHCHTANTFETLTKVP